MFVHHTQIAPGSMKYEHQAELLMNVEKTIRAWLWVSYDNDGKDKLQCLKSAFLIVSNEK